MIIKILPEKTGLPSAIPIEYKSVITDTLECAEVYANILLTIAPKYLKKLLCSDEFFFKIRNRSCMHSFMFHKITPKEVSNCICKIKPYPAQGIDGIFHKFVKLARSILSPYLAKLLNKYSLPDKKNSLIKTTYVDLLPLWFQGKQFCRISYCIIS